MSSTFHSFCIIIIIIIIILCKYIEAPATVVCLYSAVFYVRF